MKKSGKKKRSKKFKTLESLGSMAHTESMKAAREIEDKEFDDFKRSLGGEGAVVDVRQLYAVNVARLSDEERSALWNACGSVIGRIKAHQREQARRKNAQQGADRAG